MIYGNYKSYLNLISKGLGLINNFDKNVYLEFTLWHLHSRSCLSLFVYWSLAA